jgi:hypothetical protein
MMATDFLEGPERERQIDLGGGGCHCCGFMEEGLIVHREADGATLVSCRECFDQFEVTPSSENLVVYLPEMPPPAFSHYVRVLAFLTFAARADIIAGHDFSTGTLPETFNVARVPRLSGPNGWLAPLRWKTLSEGLQAERDDDLTTSDLAFAKRSFGFLKSRIEHAKGLLSGSSFVERQKADPDGAKRDYRIMAPGIDLDRIRSWGKPGSSFRLLERQEQ